MVEIYALTDPESGEVRYIGKANNAQKRLKAHLSETRRKTPLYCWIQSLRARGLVPGLKIIALCPSGEWKNEEIKAINAERLINPKLLNIAEGGDEPFCPTHIRAENGRKNSKARVDTPFKADLWQIKTRMSQLLRQGYGSNESREKLREAARKCPELFGCYAGLKNREQ